MGDDGAYGDEKDSKAHRDEDRRINGAVPRFEDLVIRVAKDELHAVP